MTDKNAKNENSKIRIMTFFPPFIILVAFLVLSLVDQETFLGVINNINNWIIKNLGWAASILALAIVIVAVVAMFSKFGDVRIGGEDAKPELSNFSWFTIALTTTMAAGVLFWGPGEPIAHYAYPPTELYGVEPSTSGSLKFAMETMFLHWTIVPYCMYTVPAVVFAFMYYNAKKPYSQDICFVPDGDYATFIRRHTGKTDVPGDFTDESGKILGQHKGITHYTVGQRKGLGVPSNEPLYVKAIDPARNRVVLSGNAALYSRTLTAGDLNWIAWDTPPRQFQCSAKTRYRQTEQPCTVTVTAEGRAEVCFDMPQRAITPGQAVVFYEGDTVLGGGTIL